MVIEGLRETYHQQQIFARTSHTQHRFGPLYVFTYTMLAKHEEKSSAIAPRTDEKSETEWLRNLSKVTELANDKARHHILRAHALPFCEELPLTHNEKIRFH